MISVIIPVYNAEEYLPRCLDSIINQTYSNIEIILVNDGSSDSSEDICLKYANVDKRIRYIYKDNEGAGAARYDGVALATGNFIFFVDSDDYLSSNALSILRDAMEPEIDCVIGQHSRFGSSRQIKQVDFPTGIFDFEDDETYIDEIVNNLHGAELWNKLFRTDLLKRAWKSPITVTFGEDLIYLIEFYAKCKKIKCIADITYYYEFRDNSLARSTNNLMILPKFVPECVQLETVIYEGRTLYFVYPLIVYHILSVALVKYVGDSSFTKSKIVCDIEHIADMEEMRDYAKRFLNKKRVLKKKYKLEKIRYCQAIALYKSIIHKDAWYYTRLYPAMIENRFSWIYVIKAYINKIIGRVKK